MVGIMLLENFHFNFVSTYRILQGRKNIHDVKKKFYIFDDINGLVGKRRIANKTVAGLILVLGNILFLLQPSGRNSAVAMLISTVQHQKNICILKLLS